MPDVEQYISNPEGTKQQIAYANFLITQARQAVSRFMSEEEFADLEESEHFHPDDNNICVCMVFLILGDTQV